MPQNMQRRPKVANLELDESEEQELENLELEAASVERLSDEEYYEMALRYLKRGSKEKDITSKLVIEGMPRIEAKKLVEQVAAENPEIGRTNAYILFGTGAVLLIPGTLLTLLDMINFGALISPYLLLVAIGGWFVYKGVQAYRTSK